MCVCVCVRGEEEEDDDDDHNEGEEEEEEKERLEDELEGRSEREGREGDKSLQAEKAEAHWHLGSCRSILEYCGMIGEEENMGTGLSVQGH